MHRAERSHRSPVFHSDVSAQRGRVRHDDVIPNLTVMRNVRIRHYESVAAPPGRAAARCRSPVDGHVFADLIVVPDLQSSRLALVRNILRRKANRTKRIKTVVRSDRGRSLDGDVREQMTPFAKLDVGPTPARRTDLAGGMYFALRIDDRRRMNRHFPKK